MSRYWITLILIVTGGFFPAPVANADAGRAAAMAEAARAFIGTLDPAQKAAISRPFSDDAGRVTWSNLPVPMAPRIGVPLGSLSDAQRLAFHRMLHTATSSQGYHKVASIMWIDDILRIEEEATLAAMPEAARAQRERIVRSRDSGQYWVTIFGAPGDADWGWMLTGHHLAANFTVSGGRVAFTPLFLGASPQTVKAGKYAGWRVLEHEIDSGFALALTLDASQRKAAMIGPSVSPELFTGRGRKDSLKAPIGLSAAKLRKDQQAILWGLIDEFVGDAADGAAAAQMAAIRRDGLAKLRLAWWGSASDPSQRFMYRIHGPSILIEYTREPSPGATSPAAPAANHVHAIVRDPRNDYGEDWLGKHYIEAHH